MAMPLSPSSMTAHLARLMMMEAFLIPRTTNIRISTAAYERGYVLLNQLLKSYSSSVGLIPFASKLSSST